MTILSNFGLSSVTADINLKNITRNISRLGNICLFIENYIFQRSCNCCCCLSVLLSCYSTVFATYRCRGGHNASKDGFADGAIMTVMMAVAMDVMMV